MRYEEFTKSLSWIWELNDSERRRDTHNSPSESTWQTYDCRCQSQPQGTKATYPNNWSKLYATQLYDRLSWINRLAAGFVAHRNRGGSGLATHEFALLRILSLWKTKYDKLHKISLISSWKVTNLAILPTA